MRNLLGRLNARTPDDLARIADFWGVPLPTGERSRHRQIGGLYRALTEPRTVRDAWDRLSPPERETVRLLVLGDEDAMAVADLAGQLGVDEAEAHRIAAALYRAGIIAREGDDEPLPPGAIPRLFVPRELAQQFRRVQDEIEAGELSSTPLRALLELLDDAELEEAATLWGIRVIPGLRRREDLSRQLLQQVADAARLKEVAAKRSPVAARIWRRVRDEPSAAPVPLAAAAAAAELDPANPRQTAQLRHALAELEGSLLVWHSYRPDGSRWLFVPAEIRAARAGTPLETALPEPVAPERIAAPSFRDPHALAWDLLTLLRELTVPGAPQQEDPGTAPRPWLRHLNRRLWHRGEDVPPPGYLSFLTALGIGAGLLGRRDDGDDAATFQLTPALRAWRNRPFPEQSARLREVWLGATDWIEGRGRTELAIWGADWRGFRRRLLALLDHLAPASPDAATWYMLPDVAEWAAARDPDLLGATFTAATARREDPAGAAADRRRAAVAEAVVAECETGLAWTGSIELTAVAGRGRALRVPRRQRESAGAVAQTPETASAPALTIAASGEISLERPTPLLVWSLSAFATPEKLDRVSRYRLSEEGMARALAAGFDLDQVTAFLTRQSGGPLPSDVAAQLDAWARGYRRVRLRRALLLTPDDGASRADLESALAGLQARVREMDEQTLLIELDGAPPGEDESAAALLAALRAAGFTPQWTEGQGQGTRRQRDEERRQDGKTASTI